MKRSIAFFDFDGTITTKDTLLEFIRYHKGNSRYYLGFFLNSPYIIAWKLGLIANYAAKEKVMRHFFAGMPAEDFQRTCDDFATNVLPGLLRPKALHEIWSLQDAGAEVVIVSASPGNWSEVWRKQFGIEALATKLAVKDARLTGYFDGRNCHGEEKVSRIRAVYDLSAYEEIYCYCDTSGDLPMLNLGTKRFYRPFR